MKSWTFLIRGFELKWWGCLESKGVGMLFVSVASVAVLSLRN